MIWLGVLRVHRLRYYREQHIYRYEDLMLLSTPLGYVVLYYMFRISFILCLALRAFNRNLDSKFVRYVVPLVSLFKTGACCIHYSLHDTPFVVHRVTELGDTLAHAKLISRYLSRHIYLRNEEYRSCHGYIVIVVMESLFFVSLCCWFGNPIRGCVSQLII